MEKKKKWYDSWWGALWALAVIDGVPGRSLRTFMEVDEALSDLDVEEGRKFIASPRINTQKTTNPCPAGSSANCEI